MSLSEMKNTTCPKCGAQVAPSLRNCSTCQTDNGAPNVRACSVAENLGELLRRFEAARESAEAKGMLTQFTSFADLIERESGVVVAMPSRVARDLFEDERIIYVNYEELAGAGLRKPADPVSDRYRAAVAGTIFGVFGSKIVYGVLSLNSAGLRTYGHIQCKLKSVAIDDRTSFLETNSYRFVERPDVKAGKALPYGFNAPWAKRHHLALSKLSRQLSMGQTRSDWENLLVVSTGEGRESDEFIEAHVFEGFDRYAVETAEGVNGVTLSKRDRLDADLALDAFTRARKSGK